MPKLFVDTKPLLSAGVPFDSSKFTRFGSFCIFDQRFHLF